MLEKKFKLNCNKLAKSDPLKIALTGEFDYEKYRVLQYLGHIGSYTVNTVVDSFPEEKLSPNYLIETGEWRSLTSVKGKSIDLKIQKINGQVETKLKYDESDLRTVNLADELDLLYRFFNRLTEEMPENVEDEEFKRDFDRKAVMFRCKLTRLLLAEREDSYQVVFTCSGKDAKSFRLRK